ncbi:hypothetical protein Q426_00855 [Streptococcus equi subsp. zooepidemicus CY]|uniref:Uncharacterized protein n=1 Tax=Streptococcus equi subsp. ruminatorum CECT 5772 TaxID=1051981 RepID=A0A922T2S0_9STRE|nr:hypothetical protein Q426_00855 [Streptococcus equi subsp. zooepidemicus CY]KED04540.1 hypothetical protein CECT5772_04556 [Streptococcus equi subsp. ruminatorum CECT 5772]
MLSWQQLGLLFLMSIGALARTAVNPKKLKTAVLVAG